MKIYSQYNNEPVFNRLRRKKWGGCDFLVAGEWSQSPYHQGNITFHFALNLKGDYCALLINGFPRRVECIAQFDADETMPEVLGTMMHHLRCHGGSYVEGVYDAIEEPFTYREVLSVYDKLRTELGWRKK
jgi:hypothetical protein